MCCNILILYFLRKTMYKYEYVTSREADWDEIQPLLSVRICYLFNF